jgi:hypothetical protein
VQRASSRGGLHRRRRPVAATPSHSPSPRLQFLLRGQHLQCYPCLEAQILNKLRGTLKAPGALAHSGTMVVAFSGGPSSSLLLHLLNSMRDPSVQWYDKRKMAFELTVVHVVEDDAVAAAAAAVAARVAPDGVEFVSVPLSDVFEAEEPDKTRRDARLAELLAAVRDPTGAADLRAMLRLRVLLERCRRVEATVLAFGDNAAATAAAAVAAVVKGGGYSVPGASSRIDRRHVASGGPTLLYPLREIPEEECGIACSALGLPQRPQPRSGAAKEINKHDINALAEVFVTNVLKHNPGAVSNINSTVSRLQAFPWNEGGEGAEACEAVCPVCFSPLADDEVCGASEGAYGELAGVCESCVHQVFGGAGGGGAVRGLMLRGVVQAVEETAEAWHRVGKEASGEEVEVEELRRRLVAALP